ncbi:hypothetical protein DRW07_15155 [Alteromonas sediminis]|uniref:Uncharacterized protein n=1 Tax=Alteromonas sediminis TaxID=2259342 RepID=A0A3N5Z4Z7_9ALTE|nr:hypothetical protein [Alteromonas sediminis]RPJ65244.1 hypothetical protein DRW07_15155 [Alteromonas sediminis]
MSDFDFVIYYIFFPIFALSFISAMSWLIFVTQFIQYISDKHPTLYEHLGHPVIHILFWRFPKSSSSSVRVHATGSGLNIQNIYTFDELKSMSSYATFILKAGYRKVDDPMMQAKGGRARAAGLACATGFSLLLCIVFGLAVSGQS